MNDANTDAIDALIHRVRTLGPLLEADDALAARRMSLFVSAVGSLARYHDAREAAHEEVLVEPNVAATGRYGIRCLTPFQERLPTQDSLVEKLVGIAHSQMRHVILNPDTTGHAPVLCGDSPEERIQHALDMATYRLEAGDPAASERLEFLLEADDVLSTSRVLAAFGSPTPEMVLAAALQVSRQATARLSEAGVGALDTAVGRLDRDLELLGEPLGLHLWGPVVMENLGLDLLTNLRTAGHPE